MNSTIVGRLKELYSDTSKHSRYQNVPEFVREALDYREEINEEWRGDTARYQFFRSAYDFANKTVCDVGANTGFFTLSLAHAFRDRGAHFIGLEGNPNHVKFIRLIAESFHLNNVTVLQRYIDLASVQGVPVCDGVLHLNVLHHAGADFDQGSISSPAGLYDYAVNYMRLLRERTKSVIFQMGYNWGGNKQKPVVALNDDLGKLAWTGNLIRESGWKLTTAATAFRDTRNAICYRRLSCEHLSMLNNQPDSIRVEDPAKIIGPDVGLFSEFYRRPIFILERE